MSECLGQSFRERKRRAAMKPFFSFDSMINPISCAFQMRNLTKEEHVIKGTVKAPESNSFILFCICRAVAEYRRVIRSQTWLAGLLILLSFPSAFAESDFSTFWKNFKSAVMAGDKAKVAEVTKFPLSMPYEVKTVKTRENFLRRYDEIFKGEANATRCFAEAKPQKESAHRYEVYCPFKDTPNDRENAPIRFMFELTKGGWKFAGLDNVNE
jgi:hypothetical protein